MSDLAKQPAFPFPATESTHANAPMGLSVREYYAGLAMQAQVTSDASMTFYMREANNDTHKAYAVLASDCCAIADALIAELEKSK